MSAAGLDAAVMHAGSLVPVLLTPDQTGSHLVRQPGRWVHLYIVSILNI